VSDEARRLIERLSASDDAREVIAGVVPGALVRARTASGIVRSWNVATRGARGIFILQPKDHRSLVVVDEPSVAHRERYLEALPALRVVAIGPVATGPGVFAVPFNVGDARARFGARFVHIVENALVPRVVVVHGDVGARAFDTVVARFDGAHLWAHDVDRAQDPTLPDALRALTPDARAPASSTPEQRAALGWSRAPRALLDAALHPPRRAPSPTPTRRREVPIDPRERLRDAVERGGGEVREIIERADVWWVTLRVRGAEHTVAVAKDGHQTITSSGICLSGRDRDFDLTSIVRVLDNDD